MLTIILSRNNYFLKYIFKEIYLDNIYFLFFKISFLYNHIIKY